MRSERAWILGRNAGRKALFVVAVSKLPLGAFRVRPNGIS